MYFIPYKANEFLENSFFQVPKELFVNPYYTDLSLASKVLYGLLLDRLSLSIKNKWTDKDGDIYIIFSRKEAQEKLNLSDKTVTKAFKELKNKKLIREIRTGFKKNNIIKPVRKDVIFLRDYFCGWYFKCQSDKHTIAVIPAYHRSDNKQTCSIQL